jgi:hypothetical protein
MITHNHEQDLILDPGRYSIDPDQTTFNAKVSPRIDLRFNSILK